MSQENVDVLKRGMECFERRDVEAAMELLTEQPGAVSGGLSYGPAEAWARW